VTADQRDDHIQVVPPRVVKPSLPHGLDRICMRALAHDPRDRYGRMQSLIDALVEERFANGYREGAADLAAAIREVAPRSDFGSPRTMHTDRPITIVTRSLLRDVTPARRPSYPLAPDDPPPANAFPMQPTVAATSARAIELTGIAEYPAPPPTAATIERAASGLPQLYENVPGSGAQTVAREVDQVALAEAAAAAAALLQLPAGLRADSNPMPPFRPAQPGLPGDELASVIGGHTISGHAGAVAVAVEQRGHRWTVGVLVAAALIGVGAAIALQLTPDSSNAAVEPVAKPAEPFLSPSSLSDNALEPHQPAPATPSLIAPSTAPSSAPTVPLVEPAAPSPGAPSPTVTPIGDGATPPGPAAAAAPTAEDPAPTSPVPAAAPLQDPPVAPARSHGTEPGTGDAKPTPRRTSNRESGKHKLEPGVLSVQSTPWSWVTVGNQKKETPDRFYLAPGTYLVKFYNQENDLTKYERVTIEPGKLVRLDLSMD
jgi:hypothetical protein